jgi:DNA-binding LytR/AlgR family response regulator
MNAIIIEDEDFAALRLENMIAECDKTIRILAKLPSVSESVNWLKNNPHPDLIFCDIQLEDDLSFAIFDKVEVNSKIIFTTAFDEYAIKAFKLKSIDYLLKPIAQTDLNQAIAKYRNWHGEQKTAFDPAELKQLIMGVAQPVYRDRFMVSVGEKLKTVYTNEIAYFFSTSGITFVVLNSKKQYSIDLSLDQLKDQLDPKQFYRVNRQFLIKLSSIVNVHVFPKSRLKLELNPLPTDEVFVSIDKVPDFKVWLDGE